MHTKTKIFSKNTTTLSRDLFKPDFHRLHRSSLGIGNENKYNTDINKPRESSYISLQTSFNPFQFKVTHKVADNTQHANSNAILIVNLGPIALFSEAKLTIPSKKHLEKVENLHVASLLHKFLSFSAGTTDLIYGFENISGRIKEEVANKKAALQKRFFLISIRVIEICSFADQVKITNGIGYKFNKNVIRMRMLILAKTELQQPKLW